MLVNGLWTLEFDKRAPHAMIARVRRPTLTAMEGVFGPLHMLCGGATGSVPRTSSSSASSFTVALHCDVWNDGCLSVLDLIVVDRHWRAEEDSVS